MPPSCLPEGVAPDATGILPAVVLAGRAAVSVLAGCVLLAGCFTGERPRLSAAAVGGASGVPTGDDAVDSVLRRLEGTARTTLTATYTVVRHIGEVSTPAQVTQDTERTSVTIGDVRFLSDRDETCNLSSGSCAKGMVDQQVSDTGVTHEFYGPVAARRLRVAKSRATGPTTAHSETIGGYPAVCVDVPVGAGSETYCANDLGVVSRWVSADVTVELDSLSPSASPELFGPTA